MKLHAIFLAMLLAFINISARAEKNISSYLLADTTSLQGEWYLQPVLPSDTAAGKVPVIKFETGIQKFTGNTGCNAMRGTFEYTGSKLVFGRQIVSTKMACQGYNEEIFIENLLKTDNYKIEDDVLMLMQDKTVLSRWKKEMPKMNPQKA